MTPSRISVAMATFNGERHLAAQLESIAQQTLAPHELVVSDDGSTDSTLEIVEAFERRAPFHVRIERNPTRLGFAANFLTAAERCEGELIAFADQDDVWLSTKLERAAAAFAPGVVLGERIYHDEWIHVLAQVTGSIAFLPDVLTLYRQHGVNVTGAPGARLRTLSRDAVTVGFDYYSNRAAQAEEWSNLFAELGAEADPSEGPAFARAAQFFRDLGRRLRLRLEVYAPAARGRRLAGLTRIGLRGAYGRRSRGGFGLSGFARDVLMIALGRR